jgi:hypothetical protein
MEASSEASSGPFVVPGSTINKPGTLPMVVVVVVPAWGYRGERWNSRQGER